MWWEMVAMADQTPNPSRRQVLKGLGVVGGVAVAGGIGAWAAFSDDDGPSTRAAGASGDTDLDALADAIVPGGPGKDGIPPIDEPKFLSASKVDFLHDDEPVFGLVRDGDVRAYPQQVLVWHEIVNDTVAGQPISVTYCPLTGTVVGFTGLPGRPGATFGTSGKLVNSNLLMYDRPTDSQWPQVPGVAITGELYGKRLNTVPLVWTSWRAWREAHPDTTVLSRDTGALRDYGADPYGSYLGESGYYVSGAPIFSVQRTDDRFPPKHVVMGVRAGNERLAIDKNLVREEGTVEADVGGTTVRAEWDDALATARVLREDGSEADFMDAMWFCWYAYYPDTRVRA